MGPELRRGVLEWDGRGEAVGGIVVMRSGENALQVIRNVKKKLKELERGLPPGVVIEAGYNRAELILSAIHTLKSKLVEELTVVALICLIFLLHFRSAFVAVFTLPVGILMAFIAMKILGINANIMSLSGIAIAIGVMVDASVVLVENAHKHLARDNGKKSHTDIILDSAKEVGPALFYSLLIITVSFLPVFSLTEQSGRMFKPLAYTKTFALAASAVLAITIVPVLMTFFVRERTFSPETTRGRRIFFWILAAAGAPLLVTACGTAGLHLPDWSLVAAFAVSLFALICLIPQRIVEESKNPMSRFFIRLYMPMIVWVLKWRKMTVLIALLILALPFIRSHVWGANSCPR